jgi:DNA-binding NarL/FixJ family response regulator
MTIKVSIVEDDRETRESLRLLLSGAANVRCLRDYGSGEEAIRGIPVEKPDVVMVDINLPGISGIECINRLKLKFPDLRVLVLTSNDDGERIFDSLRAGASGYLLKKSGYTELIQAIEQIHAGGAPMSMQVARQVVDHFYQIRKADSDMERLTSREQEILALLAKGCLNKEISDQLGIGMSTVSTHLQHIYEKLHVQSRTAAAAKFFSRS